MTPSSVRRASAELIGTGALVAVVVGSGIMATGLTDDAALQLLINALATVAGLAVLIWSLGPVSGAHFNPAVTVVAAARRELTWAEAGRYCASQVVGGLLGTAVAHLMFDLPAWTGSQHSRHGWGQWLGEIVATAGLIYLIGALTRRGLGRLGPALVPAWIGAAYFFTSSTSFANPAVTIARSATDSFSGIAPRDVIGFLAAQLAGAALGAALTAYYHPRTDIPELLDRPAPAHEQA
jgi:glycerol uptake facilitator-like aquaporin